MKIQQRYASAVHSSNLNSATDAVNTDTDTLGAMGLASRALEKGWRVTGPGGAGHPVKPAKLAVPLERLYAGDNREAHDIVRTMTEMVWKRSRAMRVKLARAEAADLARACLAWHAHGTCQTCGGHGVSKIPETTTLSEEACEACHGMGKVPLEAQFSEKTADLARWLVSEMQRESGRAGPAAMEALGKSSEI